MSYQALEHSRHFRRVRCAALLLALLTFGGANSGELLRDTFSDTWVATDGAGRTLPSAAECGAPKAGKFVGIFYYVWMQRTEGPVLDISQILAADPDAPKWGPKFAFHWWGQPHLGYYLSSDEFVIRKHAQMLSDAGVDVVILDVTNALTYDATLMTLCRVYGQMRASGARTPQISFLANSQSAKTVQHLYEVLYAKKLYPELWFRWLGKPLLMASPEGLSDEIQAFFTLRQSWAWTDPKGWFKDGKDKWPWLDHYPQRPGWHENPGTPEQIVVEVAQHPIGKNPIGRSYDALAKHEPPPEARKTAEGPYFAAQWRRGLEVNPPFIFVTQWNEWMAQRFLKVKEPDVVNFVACKPIAVGETYFVDEFSQEFSRDTEPMRGGHGDNFYYQLVAGIRRFKGVRDVPPASAPKTIHVGEDFSQWSDVAPEFRDDLGDTTHRKSKGQGGAALYENTTGRNDLDVMKVARDADCVYFYARTKDALTDPLTSPAWMLLFLDTDQNASTGWNGYDFVIGRTISKKDRLYASVEKNAGGWKWERVGEVPIVHKGNELHFAVPRALIGMGAARGPLALDFKWADNIPESGDILDFIDKGDVAPNGRFNYRYRTE